MSVYPLTLGDIYVSIPFNLGDIYVSIPFNLGDIYVGLPLKGLRMDDSHWVQRLMR